MRQKFALIAPAMFNWSETQRMIEIGNALNELGYRIAVLGEGKYAKLIEKTNFEHMYITADKNWFTDERIKKMLDIDRYGNDYASYDEIYNIVNEEILFLRKEQPDVVITGYRTTLSVSTKVVGIPLVWCLSAVITPMYFCSGLASFPDNMDMHIFLKKYKSESVKQEYVKKFLKIAAQSNSATSIKWNKVLKSFGINPFKSDLDIFKGDLNLMTDAAELFPEDFQEEPQYKFCGPIFPEKNIVLPECIKSLVDNKKKSLLVVMGSSGHHDVFMKVLECLKTIDINIFVATVGIINEEEIKLFPSNFYFFDSVPLIETMKYMDGCIMHGGQGTMYANILSGKPFVGIPMFNEQQYNLENLCRYGCGILIRQKDLNENTLKEAINKILFDDSFSDKMSDLSEKIQKYWLNDDFNSAKIAAKQITEFLYKV